MAPIRTTAIGVASQAAEDPEIKQFLESIDPFVPEKINEELDKFAETLDAWLTTRGFRELVSVHVFQHISVQGIFLTRLHLHLYRLTSMIGSIC